MYINKKKHLDFKKIRIIFKGFFEAQSTSLIWMFYSNSIYRRINNLHQRSPRLICDYELTFEELLEIDESFTIHHCNIQMLCIELYKVCHNLSQTIFSVLFSRNSNSYNFCSKSEFVIPQVRTVVKGSNSISYYGPGA